MSRGYGKSKPTANFKALIISILISEGVGILSSLLSFNVSENYNQMLNPPFAPPSSIFRPVWIILYLLMGIAAYRIYETGICREDVKDALFFYGSQLVFNFMWSILFFRFNLPDVAFLDILILLIFIIITVIIVLIIIFIIIVIIIFLFLIIISFFIISR